MIKIEIPGELTDLNEYIKAINSNRYKANNIKQENTKLVSLCAIGKPKVEEYPVHIKFKWYSKNKRKDIDNVAFSKKYVLDGLVLRGILLDDGRKYVSSFTDEFYIDEKNPRVEVEISTQ